MADCQRFFRLMNWIVSIITNTTVMHLLTVVQFEERSNRRTLIKKRRRTAWRGEFRRRCWRNAFCSRDRRSVADFLNEQLERSVSVVLKFQDLVSFVFNASWNVLSGLSRVQMNLQHLPFVEFVERDFCLDESDGEHDVGDVHFFVDVEIDFFHSLLPYCRSSSTIVSSSFLTVLFSCGPST